MNGKELIIIKGNGNKMDKLIKEMIKKRTPIVEKCIGCNKIEGNFCKAYINPNARWRLGNCALASHIVEQVKDNVKKRVGQQKGKRKRRK